MKNTFSKGFTLVELLIVIAILAALAAAVVVVINPGELLAQARDSQRMRDMTTVRDAINLFMTQVPGASFCSEVSGGSEGCAAAGVCTFATGTAPISPFGGVTPPSCPTANSSRLTNGTGWVDINFDADATARTLTTLPMDPTNNNVHFYAYKADNTARTFRLATRLESVRHRGTMMTDGGPRSACGVPATPTWTTADCFYEVGTNMLATF